MEEDNENGRPERNLILCSDGTGGRAGKGRGTNVWRLYEAVDRHAHERRSKPGPVQLAAHDDGVGTSTNKLLKIAGGAFGYGLARNVRELYAWLALHYTPGDRIFLFGFSRGAFTVRCLATMIANCGVLDASEFSKSELRKKVSKAWWAYKKTQRTIKPTTDEAEKLKSESGVENQKGSGNRNVPIHFVGVWDTVDAYGFPIDEVKEAISLLTQLFGRIPFLRRLAWTRFDDRKLHSLVKNAYHAVALDDERLTFHPVLWDEEKTGEDQTIEQVWFAGMHSDVGGGYARGALARLSLSWMMNCASAKGLELTESHRNAIRDEETPFGPMHNSRSGVGVIFRYCPRDVQELCEQHHMKKPKVHPSVLERIHHMKADHPPRVLPGGFSVVDGNEERKPDREVLERKPDREVLKRLRGVRWWRRRLYFCFLGWIASLILVATTLGSRANAIPEPEWSFLGIGHLFRFVKSVLPEFLANAVTTLRNEPFWTLLLTAFLVVLAVLRNWLRGMTNELARAAWGFGKEPDGFVAKSVTSTGAKLSRRLGVSPPLRKAIPVLLAVLLGLGLCFAAWNLVIDGDHVLPPEPAEEVAISYPVLDGGRSKKLMFDSGSPGHASKFLLMKGERYEIIVEKTGAWKNASLNAGKWLMPLAAPFRREWSKDWFVLLGSVGSVNGKRFVIGDGSITEIEQIEQTGRLWLFINDMTSYWHPSGPWFYYDDNKGCAEITIKHVQ